MSGRGSNKGSSPPTTRRPPVSPPFRLRTLHVEVIAISAGAIHEAGRCSGPLTGRPVLGDFTVHCEPRDHMVPPLSVGALLLHSGPRLDLISSALISHAALTVAREGVIALAPSEPEPR